MAANSSDRGFDRNQLTGGAHERGRQVRHEAHQVFDREDEEEHDLDRHNPDLQLEGMEFKPGASGGVIVNHRYKGNGIKDHPDQHGRTDQHIAHDRATAHQHLDHLFDQQESAQDRGTDEGGRTGTGQSRGEPIASGHGPGQPGGVY